MEKKSNNVHFYVARDKDGILWLYLGKPVRGYDQFEINLDKNCISLIDIYFSHFGLNKDDFANLKWEDEPVEVFLNMED